MYKKKKKYSKQWGNKKEESLSFSLLSYQIPHWFRLSFPFTITKLFCFATEIYLYMCVLEYLRILCVPVYCENWLSIIFYMSLTSLEFGVRGVPWFIKWKQNTPQPTYKNTHFLDKFVSTRLRFNGNFSARNVQGHLKVKLKLLSSVDVTLWFCHTPREWCIAYRGCSHVTLRLWERGLFIEMWQSDNPHFLCGKLAVLTTFLLTILICEQPLPFYKKNIFTSFEIKSRASILIHFIREFFVL